MSFPDTDEAFDIAPSDDRFGMNILILHARPVITAVLASDNPGLSISMNSPGPLPRELNLHAGCTG